MFRLGKSGVKSKKQTEPDTFVNSQENEETVMENIHTHQELNADLSIFGHSVSGSYANS